MQKTHKMQGKFKKKGTQNAMNKVSQTEIEKARELDLYNYLILTNPNELVKICNGNYCTRTHSSLKISNGKWNYFKVGIGGKSALDYLIKIERIKLPIAVKMILDCQNILLENDKNIEYKSSKNISQSTSEIKNNEELFLPKRNKDNKKVIQYLLKRGIDEEIINECLENNIMFEDVNHNVVFLGFDEYKKQRFGCVRATNETRFMHDCYGSNKEYSFRILSQTKTDKVYIFESAIDLLSFATLLKMIEENYKNYSLISLAGVYQPAKIIEKSKVPIAIEKYIKTNPNINKIILCFDNDLAGKNAIKAIETVMTKQYTVIDCIPKLGKDYNDYLCIIKGIKNSTNYIKTDGLTEEIRNEIDKKD